MLSESSSASAVHFTIDSSTPIPPSASAVPRNGNLGTASAASARGIWPKRSVMCATTSEAESRMSPTTTTAMLSGRYHRS